MRDLAFRRSPHVVTFWQSGEHLIFNYATGVVVRGSSLAIEVLDGLGKWKTWASLSRNRSREEQRLLRRLVDLMVRRTFVTRSDEPRDVDKKLSKWRTWNPAAGLFHFATKDVRYRSEVVETSATPGRRDAATGAVAAQDGIPRRNRAAAGADGRRDSLTPVGPPHLEGVGRQPSR